MKTINTSSKKIRQGTASAEQAVSEFTAAVQDRFRDFGWPGPASIKIEPPK